MPEGVEHEVFRGRVDTPTDVALAVMPEGVEHSAGTRMLASRTGVALAVMPEGVEHERAMGTVVRVLRWPSL